MDNSDTAARQKMLDGYRQNFEQRMGAMGVNKDDEQLKEVIELSVATLGQVVDTIDRNCKLASDEHTKIMYMVAIAELLANHFEGAKRSMMVSLIQRGVI